MKVCPNVACSHRQRTGTPAEYDVDRPDCADCGAELVDGPAYDAAPSSETAARPLPPGFRSRVVVTIVALAIAVAGPWLLSLPGIRTDLSSELPLARTSVFAMGLQPILTAALLVEIVAWLVPSLRPLRHAGPEGREKLGRAVIIVGMTLAVLQAYGVARSWLYFDRETSPFLIIGSLLAGTSLLVLLATWVTRRGLGNGFALLFLGPEFVEQAVIFNGLVHGVFQREPLTAPEIARIVAIPAVLVGATVACARWPGRRYEGVHARSTGAEPYRRGAGPVGAEPPPLRLPASGITPALVLATVAGMLFTFSKAQIIPYDAIAWTFSREGAPLVIRLVVTAVLVLVFGWAFQTPTARDVLWRRVREFSPKSRPLDEGDAEVLAAIRATVLPLCIFVVLPLFVDVGPGTTPYYLPLLTMYVLDLVAEVRARMQFEGELVSVWPEHRVFAADMVAAVLRSEGIPVLLRGVLYRAMARFVHPFVPIEVMVPASRAEDATRIVRQILLGEVPPPEEVRKDEPEPPAKKKKRKKKPAEEAATA
ncbi:DUF2007 domain-containing protein [Polyangium sp. y55x31]|uniref:putative signal transducing protein n=1 Tax=Polyangium sp. y55x31 TaxID=3042688 RepID=UPI002483070E|nr:DUF2007 domain-containing protein [Polyangium sp. y55x31]MDI1479803.1 DUF2007 domain-containing protein [Polyangium sp. y55x31]